MLILALTLATLAHAQIRDYDPVTTPARLRELAASPERALPDLETRGRPRGPREEAFVNFYLERVHPRLRERDLASVQYVAYYLLADIGAHGSEDELKSFQDGLERVSERFNAWSTDEEWPSLLERWSELSEGLTGNLPAAARVMAERVRAHQFPPAAKPLLDEMNRLHKTEFGTALNEAPAAALLSDAGKVRDEVLNAFKSGRMSFADARRALAENEARGGSTRLGFEALEKAGPALDRAAVLMSQLARMKGEPTWTAHRMRLQARDYAPGLSTLPEVRGFLRGYIEALVPLLKKLVERRLRDLGLPEDTSVAWAEIELLLYPGEEVFAPYLPYEKNVRTWKRVMRESGFGPAFLRQITLDHEKRPGKNLSMMYNYTLLSPRNRREILDSSTLDLALRSRAPNRRLPGDTYILSSPSGRGLDELTTAFHEGGHALEALVAAPVPGLSFEAYAWTEVPSMTSENFARDAELLHHYARAVDGKKPSLAWFREALANLASNGVFERLRMARHSLFDLELWDYDYAAPGAQTLRARMERLDDEIGRFAGGWPPMRMDVPNWMSRAGSQHFVEGWVRNFGYDLAWIASDMVASHLSDRLEQETGRRSWFRQPMLARLYEQEFLDEGWRKPFPANIEAITGRPFGFATTVAKLEELCATALDARKGPSRTDSPASPRQTKPKS